METLTKIQVKTIVDVKLKKLADDSYRALVGLARELAVPGGDVPNAKGMRTLLTDFIGLMEHQHDDASVADCSGKASPMGKQPSELARTNSEAWKYLCSKYSHAKVANPGISVIDAANTMVKDAIGKIFASIFLGLACVHDPAIKVLIDEKLHHGTSQASTKADDVTISYKSNKPVTVDCKVFGSTDDNPQSYQIHTLPTVRSADAYFLVLWKRERQKQSLLFSSMEELLSAINAIVIVDTRELDGYLTAKSFRVNLAISGVDRTTVPVALGTRRGHKSLKLAAVCTDVASTQSRMTFAYQAAKWIADRM